jgi:hypothetical protein
MDKTKSKIIISLTLFCLIFLFFLMIYGLEEIGIEVRIFGSLFILGIMIITKIINKTFKKLDVLYVICFIGGIILLMVSKSS